MRQMLKISTAFGLIALCAGCATTKVDVTAKHAPVAAYQASTGNLNTMDYQLGDLIAMNPDTRTAWKVMNVPVKATEVKYTQPDPGTTQSFTAPFELTFSSKVPAQTQADVQEVIQGNTDLHAEKTWTRTLVSPETFVLDHDEMTAKMAKVREQNPEARFFLVTSLTAAQKVYLTFGESGTNSVLMGKYQFRFNYDQNKDLEQLVKKSPAFFSATPVALGTDKDGRTVVAVDTQFEEQLPQYSYSDTAAAW